MLLQQQQLLLLRLILLNPCQTQMAPRILNLPKPKPIPIPISTKPNPNTNSNQNPKFHLISLHSLPYIKRGKPLVRSSISRVQFHSLVALPGGLAEPPQRRERRCAVAPARRVPRRDGHSAIVQCQRLREVPASVQLVPYPLHLLGIGPAERPLHCERRRGRGNSHGHRIGAGATAHYAAAAVVHSAGAEHVGPVRSAGGQKRFEDLPWRADVPAGKQWGAAGVD